MEGGSSGGSGGSGGPESFEAMAKKGLQQLLPVLLVMMAAATLAGAGRQDAQEVSFQWWVLAGGVMHGCCMKARAEHVCGCMAGGPGWVLHAMSCVAAAAACICLLAHLLASHGGA